jgi:hypothetical protein
VPEQTEFTSACFLLATQNIAIEITIITKRHGKEFRDDMPDLFNNYPFKEPISSRFIF